MARNLFCPDCNKRTKALAVKFSELYESLEGKSKGEFICDGSCQPTTEIHKGDLCFAAVMLPNKEHPNYEIQKPEEWINDYLIPV